MQDRAKAPAPPPRGACPGALLARCIRIIAEVVPLHPPKDPKNANSNFSSPSRLLPPQDVSLRRRASVWDFQLPSPFCPFPLDSLCGLRELCARQKSEMRPDQGQWPNLPCQNTAMHLRSLGQSTNPPKGKTEEKTEDATRNSAQGNAALGCMESRNGGDNHPKMERFRGFPLAGHFAGGTPAPRQLGRVRRGRNRWRACRGGSRRRRGRRSGRFRLRARPRESCASSRLG